LGVGLIAVVSESKVDAVKAKAEEFGEEVILVGSVV
ncbi:MAG TPA: phosphoribosylformylglycinamidine cyclo-ligase, partial [Balneolaceae bacterium]|nr:phosphoribosylformylglycinamidine cyclo-ligase [Balneolaceae bacterium]